MYLRTTRLSVGILMCAAVFATGCAELFLIFGPGAAFGPESVAKATPTTTTQPTDLLNTIPAPLYGSSQLDPLLEATAGAKVIVAEDMDDDGLLDFVSGSDESQPVQLHLRTGSDVVYNTFSVAGGAPIARMVDLATADLDGDGNPDVAVLVNDTGFVPVQGADLRGAVVLLFAPADPADALSWVETTITDTINLPSDTTGMTDFAVADMDGDGDPDVVLGTNEVDDANGNVQKNIRLYLNPGGAGSRIGTTWTESTQPIEIDANPFKQLELADLDADGDLDVIASYPSAKSFNIRWLVNPLAESGSAAVAAGAWMRKFVGQQGQIDPESAGGDVVAVGDIDGDGDVDVAVAHAGFGLVQWFENPGAANLALQTFPWRVFNLGQLPSGMSVNQMQLVDLNLDGQIDCYVTASGTMFGFQRGDELQDYWNSFTILSTDPVAEIGRPAFTDVNGDGLLDIVAPLDRSGLTEDQFFIFTRITP